MPDLSASPLVPYGWDDRVAALFAAVASPDREPARVVRVERSAAVVARAEGECLCRTVDLPATGDWVAVETMAEGPVAVVRLPRWSELARLDPRGTGVQVLAANIDAVIVVAPADRVSVSRLDAELSAAWESGATPAVVLTKADLDPAGAATVERLRERLVGVEIIATSTVTGAGVEQVAALLRPGRTAVLIGPSGAGKSSLTNALVGSERMATGEVREGDKRGRHTTTSRQLLVVPGGGVVIDTPGIRSLGLTGGDAGLAATFVDIEALAAGCRFRDCAHAGEPGCAVIAAVEGGALAPARLASYRKLEQEAVVEANRSDARARTDETRRWKAMVKSVRSLPPKR